MRLTKKSDKLGYCLRHSSIKTWQCWDKLGQLEDIEDELKKNTFYGKVWQYPNKLMELRFIEICKGNDYDLDIRIVFEVIGHGNVFYNIFQYGKLFALTKEELEK